MGQNRDAPAYQEYAAALLAKIAFRTMALEARGLLYTMRLECWVNDQLPANPNDLAKVLGQPIEEVTRSLPAVMPFFKVVNGFIISPELEDYRAHLVDRRDRQSQGGKRGAKVTNGRRGRAAKPLDDEVPSTPSSNPRAPRRGQVESLVQHNPAKQSPNQTLEEGILSSDPFVAEYEAGEAAECRTSAKARLDGNEEAETDV